MYRYSIDIVSLSLTQNRVFCVPPSWFFFLNGDDDTQFCPSDYNSAKKKNQCRTIIAVTFIIGCKHGVIYIAVYNGLYIIYYYDFLARGEVRRIAKTSHTESKKKKG